MQKVFQALSVSSQSYAQRDVCIQAVSPFPPHLHHKLLENSQLHSNWKVSHQGVTAKLLCNKAETSGLFTSTSSCMYFVQLLYY